MPFVPVAKVSDIPPGSALLVEMKERDIALYCLDGQVYATTDLCPHQGASLSGGTLNGEKIVCPWHQWCFNVKDGSSPMNPRLKIKTYEVKEEGDQVFVMVPDSE
ncbi:MAG: non-heme iron oxygenase ferredoxin subunit [Nitrospirota bacterium]|nr:non-heme iron oxygenase ferredoxin subunit [Nitrospirota bacterium]